MAHRPCLTVVVRCCEWLRMLAGVHSYFLEGALSCTLRMTRQASTPPWKRANKSPSFPIDPLTPTAAIRPLSINPINPNPYTPPPDNGLSSPNYYLINTLSVTLPHSSTTNLQKFFILYRALHLTNLDNDTTTPPHRNPRV